MRVTFSPEDLRGIDLEGFNISQLELFLQPDGIVNFSSLYPTKHEPTYNELVLKIFFYVLSFTIALFGNCLVIGLIIANRNLWTSFNFYIVNLCIADLMVCNTCMWIHLVTDLSTSYPFGNVICRSSTFLQVFSVTSSILTLTVVVSDRFLSAVVPNCVRITQRWQRTTIVVIWLLSLAWSLPWLLYSKLVEFDWAGGHERYCEEIFPSDQVRRTYMTLFAFFIYFLPLTFMFVMVILTWSKLKLPSASPVRPTSEIALHMRKRAQQMVCTVLVSFIICWSPQQATLLWDVYRDPNIKKPPDMKTIKYIALYLAFSNSAINPVIYFTFNACFREAMWKLVTCKLKSNREVRVFPVESVSVVSVSSS